MTTTDEARNDDDGRGGGDDDDERDALPDEADVFEAVRSFVRCKGLVRHQIDSFDHFLETLLPLIVQENSDVSSTSPCGRYTYVAQWTNLVVCKPTVKENSGFERPLLPTAARLRNLTYSSNICCDLVHDAFDNSTSPPTHVFRRVYKETSLARIPIMLGSSACHLRSPARRSGECAVDSLGYFLVNGSEKTLLAIEKLKTNATFVFPCKLPRYTHYAECRSCHEMKLRSTSTTVMYATAPHGGFCDVLVELPFIAKLHIPLPSVFKLLGVGAPADVLEIVQTADDPLLAHTLRAILDNDPHADWGRDEVLEWLGKHGTTEPTRERRQKFLQHILATEIFPHMALKTDARALRKKALYLAHMTRRLLRVSLGLDRPSDRDDFQSKRVDAAGQLMSLQFRQLWRTFLRGVSAAQGRHVLAGTIDTCNFGDVVAQKKISSGFRLAFSTGRWGQSRSAGGQTGVAQILSRYTTLSAISNLRRISCPIAREGKASKPRQLHASSAGVVCSVETPEGSSCGLVKNMSLLCHVRTGSAFTAPIAEMILAARADADGRALAVTPLLRASAAQRAEETTVMVNGVLIGYVPTADAPRLAALVRRKRRRQALPFDLSVAHERDVRVVQITTDPGALLFPAIIASEAHRFAAVVRACPPHRCAWDRLLEEGVIEYLDKSEEMTEARVALSLDELRAPGHPYTHAHPHPSFALLGVCASIIPFPHHNQSPRNTYQSAMGKQAIGGAYTTNYNHRFDAVAHVLAHAQRPLVTTAAERFLGAMPAGCNVVCAITSYTGFNQEDSVIVSRSAVERGLFRSYVYRTYRDEEVSSNGVDTEVFADPTRDPEVSGIRHGGYAKLGDDGVVRIAQRLEDGDALIGKVMTSADIDATGGGEGGGGGGGRRVVKRCKSTFLRSDEPCVVDAIARTTTREGQALVKVRTRATRSFCVGDKIASRHGQKGVCGVMLADEDMPFTDDGITPDVIINPHAIPSRMTIGHLVEALCSRHVISKLPIIPKLEPVPLLDALSRIRFMYGSQGVRGGRGGAGRWHGLPRRRPGGRGGRARGARLRAVRADAPDVRRHGRAAARARGVRADLLPAPQAHGRGQGARARDGAAGVPDAAAHRGPLARRRAAHGRDGTGLSRRGDAPDPHVGRLSLPARARGASTRECAAARGRVRRRPGRARLRADDGAGRQPRARALVAAHALARRGGALGGRTDGPGRARRRRARRRRRRRARPPLESRLSRRHREPRHVRAGR